METEIPSKKMPKFGYTTRDCPLGNFKKKAYSIGVIFCPWRDGLFKNSQIL